MHAFTTEAPRFWRREDHPVHLEQLELGPRVSMSLYYENAALYTQYERLGNLYNRATAGRP